jgi:dihydrofolate reductase
MAMPGLVCQRIETATLPHFDAETKDAALSCLAGFEAFVLGRVTYEKFAASWSQIQGDPYFDLVNSMPKFVASRTLANLNWNATLVDGDVAEAVAVLKRRPGKNIIK